MKLLTGIARGLSKVAKCTTTVTVGTYNYIKEDIKSVPDGLTHSFNTDYSKKLAEVIEKHK